MSTPDPRLLRTLGALWLSKSLDLASKAYQDGMLAGRASMAGNYPAAKFFDLGKLNRGKRQDAVAHLHVRQHMRR
jgi:hypothetical protein